MKSNKLGAYLAPAEYIDSDHPEIISFAASVTMPNMTAKEKVQQFYLAAREIRYDTSLDYSNAEVYRASSVLRAGNAYCVGKAALFAALCRCEGVPARVAFADVTNHLASDKLIEKMGTNLFAWHGFTEVFLENRWVKASPTFNSDLCSLFGVTPLDFDGNADAILQDYDGQGRAFMKYEVLHGSFHDVPAKFLASEIKRLYPGLVIDDRLDFLTSAKSRD
ncbi:transglutaminase-like domain-containing protein [Streptomyces bobili]|uniref:transglutaminase-like domain-containing protein n=1 Tax=Streptomyces bobili TaxID=67280 RepID=UPI00380137DA